MPVSKRWDEEVWGKAQMSELLKKLLTSEVMKKSHAFVTFGRWDELGAYKSALEAAGYKNVTRMSWEVRKIF